MLLRDIAIYADKAIVERYKGGFVQRFHRETCCVVELVLSLIRGKVATKDTAKIQLVLTDEMAEPPPYDRLRQLIDVVELMWPFPFSEYKMANDRDKKELILNAMCDALSWLGGHRSWNTDAFAMAKDQAVEKGLVFEGFSESSWLSPDSRYRLRLFFRYDISAVAVYAVLYRNRSVGSDPVYGFLQSRTNLFDVLFQRS